MSLDFIVHMFFLYRLDTRLYKLCRQDAKEICSAPDAWHMASAGGGGEFRPQMRQLVFACLYRHLVPVTSDPDYKVTGFQISACTLIILAVIIIVINIIIFIIRCFEGEMYQNVRCTGFLFCAVIPSYNRTSDVLNVFILATLKTL